MTPRQNIVDFAPHTIAPTGREVCLACPVKDGCVYEMPQPQPIELCPLESRDKPKVINRRARARVRELLQREAPLTIREIVERARVDRTTVQHWVSRGVLEAERIPYGKKGRRTYWLVYG